MSDNSTISKLFAQGAEIFKGVLRNDAWENVFTGLGTRDRDKAMLGEFKRSLPPTDQELEDLYHFDFLAKRIVMAIIEDAIGPGITFKRKSAEGEKPATPEEHDQLVAALQKWNVHEKLIEAAGWGRLYGRGALFPVLSDSPQDQPVDFEDENLRLLDLIVLEKRDFSGGMLNPITYEPETWLLATDDPQQGTHVHKSRLIMFGGVKTSHRERVRLGWSDHSVLTDVRDLLRDVHSNWRAVVNRMQDASQGVFKLKGLFDMIAGGEEGVRNLQKRMHIVDLCRSVARALAVDADEESFEYQEVGFQGVPEVLQVSFQLLASAAEMPMTKLFGLPTGGLGDSDLGSQRNWNRRVANFREQKLRRPHELIVNLVAQTEGLGRGWVVCYPSPWSFTPTEEADYKAKIADIDSKYVAMGVLLAEEVALTRFGHEGGFFRDPEIDLDLRHQLLDLALTNKQQAMAENPPSFEPGDPNDSEAAPEAAPEADPEAAPEADPETDPDPPEDDEDEEQLE